MNGVADITIPHFLLIYLLLIIVLAVMKRCQISQTKLLFVASLRMTVQLIIAGFVLMFIFEKPNPLFTSIYIIAMIAFATHRVISKNPWLNNSFRLAIFGTMSLSGLAILAFFLLAVVHQNFFNPQYAIPISGMIFGNAMTGLNLGLKTFHENMESERLQIQTLLNFGAEPKQILLPFVNQSLEMALLPTLNSMVGMGIISLPGMMTGQILAGTLPTTAILYQIAMMIVICTVLCLSVFGSLYLGYHTLYNERAQILS